MTFSFFESSSKNKIEPLLHEFVTLQLGDLGQVT